MRFRGLKSTATGRASLRDALADQYVSHGMSLQPRTTVFPGKSQLDWPGLSGSPRSAQANALQSSCSPIWIFSLVRISDERTFSTGHATRVFGSGKVRVTEEIEHTRRLTADGASKTAVGEISHHVYFAVQKAAYPGSRTSLLNCGRAAEFRGAHLFARRLRAAPSGYLRQAISLRSVRVLAKASRLRELLQIPTLPKLRPREESSFRRDAKTSTRTERSEIACRR